MRYKDQSHLRQRSPGQYPYIRDDSRHPWYRSFLRNARACFCLLLLLGMFPVGLYGQETGTPEAPAEESVEMAQETEIESGPDTPLIDRLRSSGMTGIALLIISVVGFSFAFERLYDLRKSRIIPEHLADQADQLWQQNDIEGVMRLATEHPSTLGRAILTILEHRDSSQADVSTMAGDQASREMRYHLLRAYPLAVVATISPLLGLFGTVYGMIGAFESVALAGEMGDPSIMAGDISYALITTALGLLIAVPALAAYHYFRVRTRIYSLALEQQLGHLISRWFSPVSSRESTNRGEA